MNICALALKITIKGFFFTMIQDTRNAAQYGDNFAHEKMGVLREDRVDPPIHTEYFHSGMELKRSIPSSCAPQSLGKGLPRDNTTVPYNLADVNGTLHDVVERSVVESAGFFTRGTWLDKHFHATETFGAINHDVSVW